jgi:hypothetical protein
MTFILKEELFAKVTLNLKGRVVNRNFLEQIF